MSTVEFIKETYKPSSGTVALMMFKISNPDWVDDIRIVNNTAAITHQGELYQPYDVQISLPTEGGTNFTADIKVKDITRVIASQLRSVLEDITMEIFMVSTLDLEYKELEIGSFDVMNYNLTNYDCTFAVTKPSVLQNSLSSYTLDPQNFPGLFLS